MDAVNNGEEIIVKASFYEMAAIVEAVRKAIPVYASENSAEIVEELTELVDGLLNPRVVMPWRWSARAMITPIVGAIGMKGRVIL